MKKSTLLLVALTVAVFTSCSKKGDFQVDFYITDAPTDVYKEVWINVEEISYSANGDTWQSIAIQPFTVNLLKFTNGLDSLVSQFTLSAGDQINQIRFRLGTNNKLMLQDGTIVPISLPSQQVPIFKVNLQSEGTVTGDFNIILDFDANHSIVKKGNGTYSLKPVTRAYIVDNTSELYGEVSPIGAKARIFAITAQQDTISTISNWGSTSSNYFLIKGLVSGTYTVKIENLTTGTIGTIEQNLVLGSREEKYLGTITIPQ